MHWILQKFMSTYTKNVNLYACWKFNLICSHDLIFMSPSFEASLHHPTLQCVFCTLYDSQYQTSSYLNSCKVCWSNCFYNLTTTIIRDISKNSLSSSGFYSSNEHNKISPTSLISMHVTLWPTISKTHRKILKCG